MGAVVDLNTRCDIWQFSTGQNVVVPKTRKEYLQIVRDTLVPDDYIDVCMGILDEDYYEHIEPELQDVVQGYYSFDM